MLGRGTFSASPEQTASRSVGFYTPVLDREPFRFFKLPIKEILVEIRRAFDVVSLYFKIRWPVHMEFCCLPPRWVYITSRIFIARSKAPAGFATATGHIMCYRHFPFEYLT